MAPKPLPRVVALRKVVAGLRGARMCFGEPVEAGGRTVIPVARVKASGGAGWGGGGDEGGTGEGGGGGGHLDAAPIGFIEVGADGSRFVAIRDAERVAATLRSLVKTAGALATTVAALRAAEAARRRGGTLPSARRLLGRGR